MTEKFTINEDVNENQDNRVAFVPHEVADALSKAAGGLVGVEVAKMSEEEIENLKERVESFDDSVSDSEDTAVIAAGIAKATGKEGSFVRMSVDSDETGQALADNLVGLTAGVSENASSDIVLNHALVDARVNNELEPGVAKEEVRFYEGVADAYNVASSKKQQ